MATIKPFSAIRPSVLPLQLELFKLRLEPHGQNAGLTSFSDCREFLDSLLENGSYVLESEAIYIYGQQLDSGETRFGIWALTSLEDVKARKIVPHEKTFAVLEVQIMDYREQVGLEGAAVVLCYRPHLELERMIMVVCGSHAERRFRYGSVVHRVWKVELESLVVGFKRALASLPRSYIADGHHRMAAASRLHTSICPQWISTLYVSTDQLSIDSFHRLIRDPEVSRTGLAKVIAQYYHLTSVAVEGGFRPSKKGVVGLYLSGIWYRLDPRQGEAPLLDLPDALLLQDRILAPGLGLVSPATDTRLECYNNGSGWEQLLLEIAKAPDVIVFTLFPMKASDLMDCADLGIPLPPKSTFISPKSPFGILMHDGKGEREGQQKGEQG